MRNMCSNRNVLPLVAQTVVATALVATRGTP
jgi:hypothetical protein